MVEIRMRQHHQVDGGAWQPYASPFLVSGEGGHTLGCYSVDGLGNIEVTQTLALNIDSIAPSTTGYPHSVARNPQHGFQPARNRVGHGG